jgi:hypothetical protein
MSDGISISFVDFFALSLASDRVRCVSARPFLVRNWSGVCHVGHLCVGEHTQEVPELAGLTIRKLARLLKCLLERRDSLLDVRLCYWIIAII